MDTHRGSDPGVLRRQLEASFPVVSELDAAVHFLRSAQNLSWSRGPGLDRSGFVLSSELPVLLVQSQDERAHAVRSGRCHFLQTF